MSDEEQRKRLVAVLKAYLEREGKRVDQKMPGATTEQKTETVGRRLHEEMQAARNNAAVADLTATLRGKKLVRGQNESARDYSGGGGYYHEEAEAIWLRADNTFRYEKRTFSSVSAGGLSLPRERCTAAGGSWVVEIAKGEPHLTLRSKGRLFASWQTRDGGHGLQYLNGQPWERFKL